MCSFVSTILYKCLALLIAVMFLMNFLGAENIVIVHPSTFTLELSNLELWDI